VTAPIAHLYGGTVPRFVLHEVDDDGSMERMPGGHAPGHPRPSGMRCRRTSPVRTLQWTGSSRRRPPGTDGAPCRRPTGPYPPAGYARVDAETHIVIPPLVRRCTECGHVTWGHRFASVGTDDGEEVVECPSCGHRFQPLDSLLLK